MNEDTGIRRIVKVSGTRNVLINSYEARKPSVFGDRRDWEERGRMYHIKGIDSLERGNTFVLYIDSEVTQDLQRYRDMQQTKKDIHLNKRDR